MQGSCYKLISPYFHFWENYLLKLAKLLFLQKGARSHDNLTIGKVSIVMTLKCDCNKKFTIIFYWKNWKSNKNFMLRADFWYL